MADPGTPNATPDDFDSWANVSARLQLRSDHECERIVADLGMTEVWPKLNEHWGRVLARDLLSGTMHRLTRYGALCARELERRRSGAPAPARLEITRPPESNPTGPLPSRSDFREQAMFGQRPLRPDDTNQRGGVPFSDDPLDHQETSKMRVKDVRKALAKLPSKAEIPAESAENEGDRSSSPAFAVKFGTGAIPIRPAPDQTKTVSGEMGDVRSHLVAVRAATAWTVEQWAHFRAEIAEHPDHQEAILARYGLGRESAWQSVVLTWQQRLEAHPNLKTRFEQAFAQGRARFAATPSEPQQ